MKQVFKIVREPTIRNGSGENYTLGNYDDLEDIE